MTQEDRVDAKFLRANWETMSTQQLAEKFKVPAQAVWRKARRLGLQRRDVLPLPPSPREIDERAAEVRAKWTREEHVNRLVGRRKAAWTIPIVGVGEIEPPSYSRL